MATTTLPRSSALPRYTISAGARSRLEADLLDLQAARNACACEQIDLCGDVADIAELAARDMALGHYDERIAHLRDLLGGVGSPPAKSAESDDPHTVRPGVVISLRFGNEVDAERFVVGNIAERGAAIEVITPTSPLGRALIGSRAGDRVEWSAPRGKITANVIEVTPLTELPAG